MNVKVFDFSQYHGKRPPAGSTQIRIRQMLKYWPELTLYRYGDKADVLIFQKVYSTQDYRLPETYPAIKILDICDPDHLEGQLVKQTIDHMDAVTCPTEALAKFLRQLTDKPVVVIPDRYDLEDFPVYPELKVSTGPAKTVLWYGYRHNAETLRPALSLIEELGLSLLVISNDDPFLWQWIDRKRSDFKNKRYKFIPHAATYKQLHLDMQGADFAVLPVGTRPVDVFKSNNRTTRAIMCGLPVATTADEVRDFMNLEAREAYLAAHYDKTRHDYDIRQSVAQYKRLITELTQVSQPQ